MASTVAEICSDLCLEASAIVVYNRAICASFGKHNPFTLQKAYSPFPCLGVLYGPLLYMSDHNSQFPVPQLAPDLQFAVDVGHINYHQVSPGPESQSVNNIADAV